MATADEFRVVLISTVPENVGEFRGSVPVEDAADYPDLAPYVEDEEECFVVRMSDGMSWLAADFFAETSVRRFTVTEGTID